MLGDHLPNSFPERFNTWARKPTFTFRFRLQLEPFARFPSLYHLIQAVSKNTGSMAYQDILYKPIGGQFSFTTRIAVFRISMYEARIYAYENDLSQQFSIPAYYGIGSRAYLNLRYSGVQGLTIEFRVARTWLKDREAIGSGLDQLPGNKRTSIKAQLRYLF